MENRHIRIFLPDILRWNSIDGASEILAELNSADPIRVAAVCERVRKSGLIESYFPNHQPSRPKWSSESGTLSFCKRVVKIGKQARNVRLILDAFEAAGWPQSIFDIRVPKATPDHPLPKRSLPKRWLANAVRQINGRNLGICFHVVGCVGVNWSPVEQAER